MQDPHAGRARQAARECFAPSLAQRRGEERCTACLEWRTPDSTRPGGDTAHEAAGIAEGVVQHPSAIVTQI